MTGEDADRSEPSGLIRICIEMRERDIADEGASSGSDVAAARDDGHGRSDERGKFQPPAPVPRAQQQARIEAERVIPQQLQPSIEGQQPIPQDAEGWCAAGGGDGSEIVVEKPGSEKEDQT